MVFKWFKLTIVLLIVGVLQICTANPIITSEIDDEVAKMFTADELQLAKNVGIPVRRLIEGKTLGFSFEEMMKLNIAMRRSSPPGTTNVTWDMYKACEKLNAEQTMAGYTSALEEQLPKLLKAMEHHLTDRSDHSEFVRSTICGYMSQPDLFHAAANTFGLPLVHYLENRFFTMKAERATYTERVIVAKQMCCLNDHRGEIVLMDLSRFTAIPNAELNEFGERWNEYKSANTLKSFERVCDILNNKDETEDVCVIGTSFNI